MRHVVAIVGRPNVGKSTLFNKLIKRRKAITSNEPGVTRDLNYGVVEGHDGVPFSLIDTGGFEPIPVEEITFRIKEQVQVAIEETDLILFIMDGREGLTPDDEEIADHLRRVDKPVIYCVNKIDTPKHEPLLADFFKLGIDHILPVSAEHSYGINGLLEEVASCLSSEPEGEEEDLLTTKIAFVGRPNVGKSTIVNRTLGYDRVIVSHVPGTTRDAVDTFFERDGKRYLIIDTAGIRRKSRISLRLERYCIVEAIKSVDRSDVVILIIDGEEGVTAQDVKIGSLIHDRGKGCIIVVNKWDLVEKDSKTMKSYEENLKQKFSFLNYAPVVFTSALYGKRVENVMDMVEKVGEGVRVRFQTSTLNSVLDDIKKRLTPPIYNGREVKIYYITQVATRPPTFMIFVNYTKGITENYRRFLL
ncbi:MAG: ribosome biogenesis GTPase Der, partial [Thermodesulfobacteriota bacterium]